MTVLVPALVVVGITVIGLLLSMLSSPPPHANE